MKAMIRTWLNQLVTENDNLTPDLFRLLALFGVLMFIIYAGFNLAADPKAWSPIAYGTGLGTALAGAGAALRFRDGPANAAPDVTVNSVTVKP